MYGLESTDKIYPLVKFNAGNRFTLGMKNVVHVLKVLQCLDSIVCYLHIRILQGMHKALNTTKSTQDLS